jgi:hypothetical protein
MKAKSPKRQWTQLSIRLAELTVERADALLDVVSDDLGRPAVRADVLRQALTIGLASIEKRRGRTLAAYRAQAREVPLVSE